MNDRKPARTLTVILLCVLVYFTVQLVGSAYYGAEKWHEKTVQPFIAK